MTFDPLEFVALQRGARDTNPSGPVHRLQWWLNLHGYACAVDGDFGPETEKALSDAQWGNAMAWQPDLGVLDERTWRQVLTAPLARAMDTLPVRTIAHTLRERGGAISIGAAVEITARQWLAQSVGGGPLRELPGNSGPVVEACTRWLAERDRLPCFCAHSAGHHHSDEPCTGDDDPAYDCGCRSYAPDWRKAWCAGWVSTVLRQACESLGVPMPLKGSLGCDVLAEQALHEGLLVEGYGNGKHVRATLHPGCLFLLRGRGEGDWTHCGVVLEVVGGMVRGSSSLQAPFIRTAEGNTNADGSRNGDRLLERVRPLAGLDFICWRSA